jgi:ATP-dependent Clp protease protease subunit
MGPIQEKNMQLNDEEEKKEEKKEQDPATNEKLLKTRQILLSGEINKESAEGIIKQLLVMEADDPDKEITIFINSPGGDVDAGYAIYDMVRFISCPVTMVGAGLVASAASLIFLAVPKEKRIGLPNSTYLIHQPMSGMKGVASDIEIYSKQIEKLRVKLDAVIAEATGKSLEEVSGDTERDHWLFSEDAKTYGLVDRIVSSRSDI